MSIVSAKVLFAVVYL